jgi:iron complex transport system substrate-binding protein
LPVRIELANYFNRDASSLNELLLFARCITQLRICSFLPSATEIVYLLGLESDLYGVTHECDYPDQARQKPKLTASKLSGSSSFEIDRQVRDSLKTGNGIYSLDYEALKQAEPDVILTQELCEVCAVSYGEIYRAASDLPKKPDIISLDTFTLRDILDSIQTVGTKCGRKEEAEQALRYLNERIDRATRLAESAGKKKRVFFMEWIDPVMSCGHWMPELIIRAGGDDIFGVHGKNSQRIEWKQVLQYNPECMVVAPCGFGVERARSEAQVLKQFEGWSELEAVKTGNVYLSDGNAYFSRPGPRIVNGLEILSIILNPKLISEYGKFSEKDYSRFEVA